MSVSIEEYEKALNSLKLALEEDKDDLVRDATIQRYEYCVELAWKTSKKIMGVDITAPKQVIRIMSQNKLIDDIQIWLTALDKRNLSSHSYNVFLAEEVYDFSVHFIDHAYALLEKLKEFKI